MLQRQLQDDRVCEQGVAFTSRDLALFETVLEDTLSDLRTAMHPLIETAGEAGARQRAAAEIFRCARSGERDPIRLKSWTIRAVTLS